MKHLDRKLEKNVGKYRHQSAGKKKDTSKMEFERPSSNLKNIDDGAGNHNELQEES